MALRIISTRIGELGAIYEPTEGINVQALIAGGFVEQVHIAGGKSAKNKNTAPDAGKHPKE